MKKWPNSLFVLHLTVETKNIISSELPKTASRSATSSV